MSLIAAFLSKDLAHEATSTPSDGFARSLRDGDGPTVFCLPGLGDTREKLRHLDSWFHALDGRAIYVAPRERGDRSAGRTSGDAEATGSDLVAIFADLELRDVDLLAHATAATAALLASLRLPSLVLMGTADLDFPDPRGEAERIAKMLGGRAVTLDRLGHDPLLEAPDLVGEVLADAWGLRRGG